MAFRTGPFLAVFAALIAVLFPAGVRAEMLLSNFRYWTAPDHTRIVVDLSGRPSYHHRVLGNPDRIAVDIDAARFQGTTRKIGVKDGLIDAIRMNQLRSGKAQVVLDLAYGARYHIFALDPVGGKPNRLVVDVFRDDRPRSAPDGAAAGVRRVIVDPGHGGEDPGALGLHRLREKDLTLDIGRRLAAKIGTIPGFEAILTRESDYFLSLKERSDFAREKQGDLFISIHANSARSKNARGFEIFFLSLSGATDKMARELADKENAADLMGGVPPSAEDEVISILFDYLQEEGMKRSAALAEQIYGRFEKDRQVNLRNVKQAGFAVLKSMQMPAVLVEVGFLTNERDAGLLRTETYRERIAQYLADGVEQYARRAGGNGNGNGNGNGHAPQPMASRKSDDKPRYHVVKSGETAWSIANLYRVKVEELLRWNDLTSSARLLVGQKLRVY